MARDYQDDYGPENEGGFMDRMGNRAHHAWDRATDNRPSPYGAGAAGDYRSGSGYGQSQLGRYSPQRGAGSSYGSSASYGSESNSNYGYSGRMSDYSGASSPQGYPDASGYGAPAGVYGRSSMGFPRGSDYGGGGSGSMGGGYFGSGAGPWSGGPYGDTGGGGYTPQRNQEYTNDSDYPYSRREQRRRGGPDDGYGYDFDR